MAASDDATNRAAYSFAYTHLRAGHNRTQIIRSLIDRDFDPELAVAAVQYAENQLVQEAAEQRRAAEIWLSQRTMQLMAQGLSNAEIQRQLQAENVPHEIAVDVLHQLRSQADKARTYTYGGMALSTTAAVM